MFMFRIKSILILLAFVTPILPQEGFTPQILHNILVPNTTIITQNEALSEFNFYHGRHKMTLYNSGIQARYGIAWPNSMLV